MSMQPCIRCGTPTSRRYCTDCAPTTSRTTKTARRGYGARWQRLSQKARHLQPWCSDCGRLHNLTTDHSPEAWRRHNAGLAVRLQDVDVVCVSCNNRRGSQREVDQGNPGERSRADASPDAPRRGSQITTQRSSKVDSW